MRTQLLFLTLLLSACVLTMSGCIVAAVGILAFSGSSQDYSKGNLITKEKESLNSSWSAAQDVAKDLQYHIVEVSKGEHDAELLAISPDDLNIQIGLKFERKSGTTFSIHVGEEGEEKKSKYIMDLIHKKL